MNSPVMGLDPRASLEAKGVPVMQDIGDLINEVGSVLHSDRKASQLIKEEEFFNEICTVLVHPSTNENDAPSFVLNVNGINQPVCRGVPTPMKRKYLEVLARMKETRYSQPVRNPQNPEPGNALIPRTAWAYPFSVQHDPSGARGARWLEAVMAEAA